ncbi:MAG TPA: histidinol-phosphate transaminase [Dehalococcoidia bacterium]|nr:histidinol-phosphate transaminase [Dehalococcoidia bacterium]
MSDPCQPSLARPHLWEMEGYEPIDPPEQVARDLGLPPERIVKLDGNENPYGPSPRAREALARLASAHLYPDPWQRDLRSALAERLGVAEAHIVCGAGSDDLLDVLARLFVGPGRRVVVSPPTFGMYDFIARLYGGEVVEVPRRDGFRLDVEAVAAALRSGAEVCFLASPNNPTGDVLLREELETLLATGALVVVDEAYIEFAAVDWPAPEASAYPLALQRPNLAVLRTFSKWAGLAGLRVGYGVLPAWMAELAMKVKMPYNLNVAAEAAALASLEDVPLLLERVRAIVSERERMMAALGRLGWLRPFPSQANFVLCQVQGRDAQEVWAGLRRQGVLVRRYSHPLLRDCIRISVGRPQDTDRLLEALASLEREGA